MPLGLTLLTSAFPAQKRGAVAAGREPRARGAARRPGPGAGLGGGERDVQPGRRLHQQVDGAAGHLAVGVGIVPVALLVDRVVLVALVEDQDLLRRILTRGVLHEIDDQLEVEGALGAAVQALGWHHGVELSELLGAVAAQVNLGALQDAALQVLEIVIGRPVGRLLHEAQGHQHILFDSQAGGAEGHLEGMVDVDRRARGAIGGEARNVGLDDADAGSAVCRRGGGEALLTAQAGPRSTRGVVAGRQQRSERGSDDEQRNELI